jgi:hypothetical protein
MRTASPHSSPCHHQVDSWRQDRLDWGANAGVQIEIRCYDGGTQTLNLFVLSPFAIAVGDAFQICPAYDKRFATCKTVWNNCGG